MKLNQEYLKILIINIENTLTPRPTLGEILKSMELEDINDDFLLHYEILRDYGFIEGIGNSYNIGLVQTNDGVCWCDENIRLTAKGHEFASALNQPEVWSILKEKFKENSIDTIFSTAKNIAKKIAAKKLENLLGEI